MIKPYLCQLLIAVAGLAGVCILAPAQTLPFRHFEANIAPRPGEDMDGPCHYSLDLPATSEAIRAVWIIFDRSRDIHDLVQYPDTLAFAQQFHVAILLHGHCPGIRPEDRGDMNMDPSAGLGLALLRSLDRFAQDASHPELRSAPFILLGFSGAGTLSAHLVNAYPQRTIAAVLSAPGHFAPMGIDTVVLNKQAQAVPHFILAGGADDRSGTRLPYDYFLRYREAGAPWTFVLQNNSPHCCTANAKPLMLAWLASVLTQRLPHKAGSPLRNVSQKSSWLGSIHTEDTLVRDSFGNATFNATQADIRARTTTQQREAAASWLPDAAVAHVWLEFVRQEHHPILSLR